MSKKVLIVDDERLIVEVIAEYLQFEGYDSCTALNGEEGLRQLEEQHPDLVITDMRMPGMDGYEFARRVRQAYDIPIIMLTGTIQTLDDLPGEKLVDAFMTKPVQLLDLLAQVESVLGCGRSEDLTTVKT